MKLQPIITSLLEQDMYKYSMGQAIYHQFSDYKTTWSFKCRNNDVKFTGKMVEEIREQIKHFCTLRYTEEELSYLDNIKWIKGSYVDFLRLWQPRYEDFTITNDGDRGLSIEAAGTWLNTSMYEIPTLAIVNEVYFKMQYAEDYNAIEVSAACKLVEKIRDLENNKYTFKFAEFGCRRRLSREWQEYVVKSLLQTGKCVGTSNVYLAMKYGCKPIGTYAHEYVQMYQGVPNVPLAYTNKIAMEEWFDEFQGDNGTALTDTLGTDLFLMDFNKLQATCYTGVRHDSGDPIVWGEKIIAHYQKLGIDPKTKTLLFSDGLDFDKAQTIYDHFKDRINVSFGIGTYLSNDTYIKPLNIVIKLQYVNGHPVAKLSDVPTKAMCQDRDYLEYLKGAVSWRIKEGV